MFDMTEEEERVVAKTTLRIINLIRRELKSVDRYRDPARSIEELHSLLDGMEHTWKYRTGE